MQHGRVCDISQVKQDASLCFKGPCKADSNIHMIGPTCQAGSLHQAAAAEVLGGCMHRRGVPDMGKQSNSLADRCNRCLQAALPKMVPSDTHQCLEQLGGPTGVHIAQLSVLLQGHHTGKELPGACLHCTAMDYKPRGTARARWAGTLQTQQ